MGLWFELKIETHITRLIEREIRKDRHPELHANFQSGRIQIHEVGTARLEECHQLANAIGKISYRDASCYFLALDLDAFLLSGDAPLRALAKAKCVKVHGTLWIFDQLVRYNTP